jgi:4-hydroxy-2-oxoheptanedioate aldolase
VRLNPVIEKLAAGRPFIGVSTEDLSFANANELTRAPIDYVYVDMEHTPFSFDNLYHFTLGTMDEAATAKRGNPQADLAVFARFPPYGREQVQWVSKQALDIGLMGIIFNSIDNAEQAAQAVQSMRYPQLKGAKIPEPNGKRGWSPALATWLWGVSQNEYQEAADLRPLNPDGNLLAIMMIETADLANSMGVLGNAPDVEQALQTILTACKAHNVACGKTMSAAEMPRRLQEGWKMINLSSSSGGLTAGTDAALKSIPENVR